MSATKKAERIDFLAQILKTTLSLKEAELIYRQRFPGVAARTYWRDLSVARENLIADLGLTKNGLRTVVALKLWDQATSGKPRDRIAALREFNKLLGLVDRSSESDMEVVKRVLGPELMAAVIAELAGQAGKT